MNTAPDHLLGRLTRSRRIVYKPQSNRREHLPLGACINWVRFPREPWWIVSGSRLLPTGSLKCLRWTRNLCKTTQRMNTRRRHWYIQNYTVYIEYQLLRQAARWLVPEPLALLALTRHVASCSASLRLGRRGRSPYTN